MEEKAKKDSTLLVAFKEILAGCMRGCVQVFVGHPLDTIKIRLQTQSIHNPMFAGPIDCFKKTFQREGLFGFYKGASSPLYMAAIYSAILFVSYGQGKRLFHPDDSVQYGLDIIPVGIFTGIFSALVEGPMELVKTKMQIQYSSQTSVYRSSVHCAKTLISTYGIKGIFQGYSATLARNIPGCIIYFYSYDQLSRSLVTYSHKNDPNFRYDSSKRSTFQVLLSGGLAGLFYWISIFPIDVIKSNMQSDASEPSQRKYKNFFHTVSKLYSERGLQTFYKGLSPCLVRSFPTNAATFFAYELTKSFLDKTIHL